MHLITAYIRPEKLSDVKTELAKAQILKISVTNALGCGDEPKTHEKYRGVGVEVDLHKKLRLEIAVNEPYVQKAVDAIIAGARTGDVGDGKIFITTLEDCVRIRTGDRGDSAIG